MKLPILSICIPTYNRASLLYHNLEVLSQCDTNYFKLIICDNGSTDSTPQVIEKWKEYFPFFQVIRHEKNIFYDRNVASGLRVFDTEYCMMLGDGYLINNNNLHNLLKELSTYKYDAIIIDAFGQVDKGVQIYRDVNKIIKEIGWYLPLVSSCVFSKKMCQESFLQRYYDSQFEPYGVLVEYICSVDSFCVKMIDTVRLELNNAGSKKETGWGHHPFQTFGVEWFKFVMSLPEKINLDSKLICLREHDANVHVFNPWSLFKAKLRGDVSFYDYKSARPILPFVINSPLWLYDLIYLIPTLPPSVVSFIKTINKNVSK